METIKKAVKKVGDALSTKNKESLQSDEKQFVKCIIPPDGHDNVGHYAFFILGEIIKDKDKKKLPHKWFRNYELFRARHWRSQGSIKLSTVNLVWNYVTRTVNLLTDNNPTFDIHAENDDVAQTIHKVSRHWWNETEQQDVLAESITTGEINGCVIEKIIFNPSLNNGFGDVEVISVDPHNFGFWPLNEKRPNKWEAALHYYTVPVNQARRKWPHMAEYITDDKLWRDKLGEHRREIFGGTTRGIGKEFGDYGVDHATFTGNIQAVAKMMGGKGEVLILEFWVKDFTTIERVVEPARMVYDEESDELISIPERKERVPKYPGNIRCITCCNGGDIVLSDRPNPSINPTIPAELASLTHLWDKFPFTLTQSNKDIVSPWGFSSIEQLESINFEIDKCLSQLNLAKDKAVRSPVINPKDAQVPNSHFTNNPAKVINPKNHVVASAIQHMKPPPVHRDIEHVMSIYRELFDKISGQFDMTDPNLAKGRMAYKTVATIIESMHTMLRGKIRSYGKMIRDRGRMYLSHAMNWFTEDRMFFVEREGGTTESGSFVGKDLIIPMHFSVVSGSTMPTSRLQQREEALELFKAGAVDVRELLERLDWPNRAEVIHRMELGQLAPIMQRLEALGVNPEVIATVQKIANMDESEYNAVVNQMKEAQADSADQGNLAPPQ